MAIARVFVCLALAVVVTGFPTANASPSSSSITNVDSLGSVMVHSEGRLQPLDSFAKNFLLQLSSRSRFEKKPALSWLARLLFNPASVGDDEVFRVLNPNLLDAIGMPRQRPEKRRYSFNELAPYFSSLSQLNDALERKQEQSSEAMNNFEKEVEKLYNNFLRYLLLSGSLSFAHEVKHPAIEDEFMRRTLGLPTSERPMTYWEVYRRHHPHLMRLATTYGDLDTNNFKDEDWTILSFIEHIFKSFDAGEGRRLFRIVPIEHKGEEAPFRWASPWQIVSLHKVSPKRHKDLVERMILPLHEATVSFALGNQQAFDEHIADFKQAVLEGTKEAASQPKKAIASEVFYNNLNPFQKAKTAYIASFVLLLLSSIRFKRALGRTALALLLLGLGLHLTGMVVRVFIMKRPPIANLYETFVFVSLMMVLLGLATERFRLKGLGLVAGSLGGAVLLLVSERFLAQGDTMGVLIAVLRSNFWLSTHVIAINLGYGGIIFSGLLAHIYLFERLLSGGKKTSSSNRPSLMPFVKGTQGFGLLFTFTGTFLGGVWADQSWGRFWGWDPKENGAILIVLWSGILFHARMAGLIKNLGFAAGAVLNIIVVMLAWFGINLLGVGLHSYGFTSGLAVGLFAYIGLQMSFLFLVLYLIQRHEDGRRSSLGHG